MKETALAADRTVAFDGFYLRRRFDLKLHHAAMASTVVLDRMNLGKAAVKRPLPFVDCTDRYEQRCCIWRGDRKFSGPPGH